MSGEKASSDQMIKKIWEEDSLDEIPEEETVAVEKPKRIQKALEILFEFLLPYQQSGEKSAGPFNKLSRVYDLAYFDEHLGLNNEDDIRTVMDPLPGFEATNTESGKIGYRLVKPKDALDYLKKLIDLVKQTGVSQVSNPDVEQPQGPTNVENATPNKITKRGRPIGDKIRTQEEAKRVIMNDAGLVDKLLNNLHRRDFSTKELQMWLRVIYGLGPSSTIQIPNLLELSKKITEVRRDKLGHPYFMLTKAMDERNT